MLSTVGALAPVFLMIALGRLMRGGAFLDEAFWPSAERLVYRVLFPALLFTVTATFDLLEFRVGPVTLALLAAIVVTVSLALLLRPWLGLDDRGFGSVFQGAIRTNTYVGLAGAGALYGDAGLAIMGIIVFVVITAVNLLSVFALVYYGTRPGGWGPMAAASARNPLILACLAGFAVNLLGIDLPSVVANSLDILGRASLTLGLLCVGAGLELAPIGEVPRAVGVTAVLKLLVMPSATAIACRALGVEGLTASAAVLFTSVPVSASAYVLTRQLGGDAPLMAGLITTTTIGAVVTMPLVLTLWT